MLRTACLIVGGSLLCLSAVLTYLRQDGDGAAYGLGSALGVVLASLAVPAFIALLVVRLTESGRVWSPGLVLVAGVFSLFVSHVQREHEQDVTTTPNAAHHGEAVLGQARTS